jgi:hypothetical protein
VTREQKAIAAYGSVVGVTLVLWFTWSVFGAILVLLLAGAAVTAVLRATRPRSGRPTSGRPVPRRPQATPPGAVRRPPPPPPAR